MVERQTSFNYDDLLACGRGELFGIVRALALTLERQQFLPVDGHAARSLDPEANLAAVDIDNCDADVVADEDLFAQFPAQD